MFCLHVYVHLFANQPRTVAELLRLQLIHHTNPLNREHFQS